MHRCGGGAGYHERDAPGAGAATKDRKENCFRVTLGEPPMQVYDSSLSLDFGPEASETYLGGGGQLRIVYVAFGGCNGRASLDS